MGGIESLAKGGIDSIEIGGIDSVALGEKMRAGSGGMEAVTQWSAASVVSFQMGGMEFSNSPSSIASRNSSERSSPTANEEFEGVEPLWATGASSSVDVMVGTIYSFPPECVKPKALQNLSRCALSMRNRRFGREHA